MSTFLPEPIVMSVGRKFSWKVFAVLMAGCVIGFFAVLPYTLALQAAALEKITKTVSLTTLLVAQGIQNLILFAVVGGLGYFLACKIGLGLPFLEGAFSGERIWGRLPRIALVAAVGGLVISGLIVLVDVTVFGPAVAATLKANAITLPASANPPAWMGFLASFYGGIVEEILLRLGMLSLLAWLGRFLARTPDNRPTLVIVWIANILAAVLFGLGHLPATAGMGIPLTPVVIVRAVVLNGMLGIYTGWLYWRYGLESAIISHFSGDLVLHVLLPLLAVASF